MVLIATIFQEEMNLTRAAKRNDPPIEKNTIPIAVNWGWNFIRIRIPGSTKKSPTPESHLGEINNFSNIE